MDEKDQDYGVNRGLRLIAKSSVFVLIGLIFSKIFMYLYKVAIARFYSVEIFGLYNLSFMIVSWVIIFSNLGLNGGLLRYIPLFRGKGEKEKISFIFKRSLLISTIVGLIAGLLIYLFAETISIQIFNNSDLVIFLKIFSMLVPLTIISRIFIFTIKAFERIGWFSFIFYFLENFVKIVSLVIFILLGLSFVSVPWSYNLGLAATLVVGFLVCRWIIPDLFKFKKTFKGVFKGILRYSWPLTFLGIVAFLFYSMDSFILGILKDVEAVGLYNAAVPLALLLIFPNDIFYQLFIPLITKEYSKGNMNTIKELSQQVGKWIFLVILPFFILFLLFPEAIINIVFGSQYIVAKNSFRILAVGVLISTLFELSKELLLIKGKSLLVMVTVLFFAGLNLVLDLLLIPRYGIDGAAFSTTLSFVFLYSVFIILGKRYMNVIPVRRKMLRISFVALISVALLLVLRHFITINFITLSLISATYIIFYIFLIFVTGCLDKNDKMIIELFKNKFLRR